jgi:hypothetical protein
MKSIRILAVLGLLAYSTAAFAEDVVFVKPLIDPKDKKIQKPEEPKIDEGSRTGGVVPRAIRSGNPLELINPFAPARYGNGSNMTMSATAPGSSRSQDYERPIAIKVFSYEF